jgi:hypothetical protein
VSGDCARERLARSIVRRMRAAGGALGDRCGLLGRAVAVCPREVDLEPHVEAQRPCQLERALEENGGCTLVTAPERAPSRACQPLASPLCDSRLGLSELSLVANGLL